MEKFGVEKNDNNYIITDMNGNKLTEVINDGKINCFLSNKKQLFFIHFKENNIYIKPISYLNCDIKLKMENKHIYIISTQRGQALPEIYAFYDNYDDAILNYYDYFKLNDYYEDFHLDFMLLFKFPINERLCDFSSYSKVKFGKSSKYRIKFKDLKDLKDKYIQIIRNKKINKVIKP